MNFLRIEQKKKNKTVSDGQCYTPETKRELWMLHLKNACSKSNISTDDFVDLYLKKHAHSFKSISDLAWTVVVVKKFIKGKTLQDTKAYDSFIKIRNTATLQYSTYCSHLTEEIINVDSIVTEDNNELKKDVQNNESKKNRESRKIHRVKETSVCCYTECRIQYPKYSTNSY